MMKRVILITLLIAGLTAAHSLAQMDQGMMGSQSQQQPAETPYGGDYYPCSQMMGNGMMGPGMMRGMMGPGMMRQGMMGSGGYGMQGVDPAVKQKYLDDTAELRKKLHNKKFEYFEAARNPSMKQETLMKLEKEILDLQWEIYEKAPR